MSNASQFSLNFRYGPSTEDRKSAKFNRILHQTDMITPGIYASSPVPDHAANQTAFNHQDAMDRFNVRNPLKLWHMH